MTKLKTTTLNRAALLSVAILVLMSLQPAFGFTPPADDPYPTEGLRGAGTRATAANYKTEDN